MFRKIVLLAIFLKIVKIESEIFDINPKQFEENPACVQLNRTFYSYVDRILKNLNRE